MERKTMGSFIAALRKSSGYTQKQLAEMLGVSDKTISHWERDESAPDISMLPIIGEIFSVSCDELIKGQKLPASEEQSDGLMKQRRDKQLKYLLDKRLTRFKVQSIIGIGISAVGFTLSCFFYLRFGWESFYIQLIFTAIAISLFTVFQILFSHSIACDDFDESLIKKTSKSGRFLFFSSLIIVLSLQCFFIPTLRYDQYLIPDGLYISLGVFIFLFAVLAIVEGHNLKEKIGEFSKGTKKLWKVRIVSFILCFVIIGTGISFMDNLRTFFYNKIPHTTFTDINEFTNYMETEEPVPEQYSSSVSATAIIGNNYDENAREVIDEIYESSNGKSYRIKFTWKNGKVANYTIYDENGQLNIKITTVEEIYKDNKIYKAIEISKVVYAAFVVLLALWIYSVKRKKIS